MTRKLTDVDRRLLEHLLASAEKIRAATVGIEPEVASWATERAAHFRRRLEEAA